MPASAAAIVTDAGLRGSVAAVRGLGRAGIRVAALGGRWAAGGRSRHAAARLAAPSADDDPDELWDVIARAGRRFGPAVVYPGQESALELLLDRWDRLPAGILAPYPGVEPVSRLRDKRTLPDLAAAAGLGVAATLRVDSAAGVTAAAGELPYPCVIKTAGAMGGLQFARVVEDADALRQAVAGTADDAELLVQEHAPGPLMAVSMVVGRDGTVAGVVQQVARRTWPHPAGPSSVAETVAPDEDLVERVRGLLARAGFWGMAEVQLLGMGAGRMPAPIDVNPRFYGSLPLALAAGVNLPALWHAVATGESRAAPVRGRAGVGYRWLEADLSAVTQGHRERLRAGVGRPRAGAMWARDDVLASALLAAASVTGRLGRLARRG